VAFPIGPQGFLIEPGIVVIEPRTLVIESVTLAIEPAIAIRDVVTSIMRFVIMITKPVIEVRELTIEAPELAIVITESVMTIPRSVMKASDSVTRATGSVTNASGFETTVFGSDQNPSERAVNRSKRGAKGIGSEEGITKVNETFSNAVPAIRGSEIVARRSQRSRRKLAIAIRNADAMRRSPARNIPLKSDRGAVTHPSPCDSGDGLNGLLPVDTT
jgi:hypothetical protein